MLRTILVVAVVVLAGAWWLFAAPDVSAPDGGAYEVPGSAEAVERGRYLVAAGGCVSCHEGTEHSDSLSGGLAIESDFGTFYAPNITPDEATGIGGWTAEDFLRALKHGRTPEGSFYYPAFPYTAYSGMTNEDVLDMAAYLLAQPAVAFEAPAHELPGWLGRWTIAGWNLLADLSNSELPEESDPVIARGAYLARHLGHCGECHTPRNSLGILDLKREFGGGVLPGGEVEAIDAEALGNWSEQQFALLLSLGLKPDGDFVGGKMEPVIEHNTSRLTREDQQALVAFFLRDRGG